MESSMGSFSAGLVKVNNISKNGVIDYGGSQAFRLADNPHQSIVILSDNAYRTTSVQIICEPGLYEAWFNINGLLIAKAKDSQLEPPKKPMTMDGKKYIYIE